VTTRTVIAWIVAAVLGLALAAGITLAASQLSSQHIGLSGEPLSAGDELVPKSRSTPASTNGDAGERHDPNEPAERGEEPDGDD
jgi:hypothetical protein